MELRQVNALFNDSYRLYKEFSSKELTEERLDEFVVAADQIYKKYYTDFAKDVVISVINEVERMEKEGCESGKTR